ncbi:ABC transporter ATP-binding protein [Polyangium sp. y55x31]|uniref:ABC transporter ATP-binding protein n=1 Tax=Polyangium sp. y55x31 TaxID=3042688 RepID=UPI002483086E|nr:ABC transporter ATP-binding protein [Polyangium sp. y55x31]MDI1477438.1 ABC transporter ATP-binding protein [Polyangium sp. y55x31]
MTSLSVDPKANGAKAAAPGKTRAEKALARFHEEERLNEGIDANILAGLWPFMRPHAKWLVISLVLLLLGSGLAVLQPWLMGLTFDAFEHRDTAARTLMQMGALILVLKLIEQCMAFPQVYLMQLAGARASGDLRVHVFRFLHTRRLGFFDRTPVGRLVTRVTNDVDAINEMFASGTLNALGDLVRLVLIVVVMLHRDWQLALITFVAVPPVALGVMWTRRRIRDAFREIRAKTARMNAYLNEQVSGMAVVQAYAREEQSAAEFDDINEAYRQANNRSIVFDAALDAAIELVQSLCIAAVLWYAGVRSLSDRVSFGTLVTFVAYIEMFFVPIRDLSARMTQLQSAMAGAERIFQLLENKEEDAPVPAAANGQAEKKDEAIAFELDHVDFEYKPGVPILRDVSIQAAKGEKIALVGATGAGKTTVASLLLRLYEAKQGEVRVFGRDVRTAPRDELRKSFAVVPQEVFLFPGTIASNIAAGDVEVDRARVVRALERIGALDLFERREGGLDAKVQERGSNFSAGERQLIAFARALYRDPPILVLDEATANIDSDTEARLQKAVWAAMQGRTALIIAHRLSTIRAVDRIVVFHKGRVVEQGSHESLLAQGGAYARLYQLQFSRGEAHAAE